MDALTLLMADHNRIRGLFTRFHTAKDSHDTATMTTLASAVFTELEVHTSIEEEIFYPHVHDLSDEMGDTVDEGIQEHHVVKTLMAEIGRLDAGADQWIAKMTVRIENVDKVDLSNDRLHELASAQQIPGRSSMDHDELAATVNPS